jgi:hypothetical protein
MCHRAMRNMGSGQTEFRLTNGSFSLCFNINTRQLLTAIDLGIVHIQAGGHAACGHGLAQAIEERIQSLVRVKLGMRNQAAGVVQNGVQEDLHASPTGALNVRAEQHIGLPDLVATFRFELLVRWRGQQLASGQAAPLEKAIQRGRGDGGGIAAGGQHQLPQQSHAGTVRILPLQSFDQLGQLGWHHPGLPAIASRLRSQGRKTTAAIAQCPIEQGIDRERAALGVGDLIVAGGI